MNTYYSSPSSPIVIRAAGGLIERTDSFGNLQLLVVYRPIYNDWSIPKGKRKKTESWKTTAVREIREETSIDVSIQKYAGAITYPVGRRYKVVFYWFMEINRAYSFLPNDEVSDIQWVNQNNFQRILTYPTEIQFVKQSQFFTRNA